jgi:hypothetical protein
MVQQLNAQNAGLLVPMAYFSNQAIVHVWIRVKRQLIRILLIIIILCVVIVLLLASGVAQLVTKVLITVPSARPPLVLILTYSWIQRPIPV